MNELFENSRIAAHMFANDELTEDDVYSLLYQEQINKDNFLFCLNKIEESGNLNYLTEGWKTNALLSLLTASSIFAGGAYLNKKGILPGFNVAQTYKAPTVDTGKPSFNTGDTYLPIDRPNVVTLGKLNKK